MLWFFCAGLLGIALVIFGGIVLDVVTHIRNLRTQNAADKKRAEDVRANQKMLDNQVQKIKEGQQKLAEFLRLAETARQLSLNADLSDKNLSARDSASRPTMEAWPDAVRAANKYKQ